MFGVKMAKYQILYWKDNPAQIKAFDGTRAVSRQLPERYQLEIDRLAMELGLAGGDEYLNQGAGRRNSIVRAPQPSSWSRYLRNS